MSTGRCVLAAKRWMDIKKSFPLMTNVRKEKGRLEDVIAGADVFIGVSVAGVVSKDMVRTMKKMP